MNDLGPLKLYRSDGKSSLMTAGIEDFCMAGCLLVGLIRVPFPDCSIHAMSKSKDLDCDIIEE